MFRGMVERRNKVESDLLVAWPYNNRVYQTVDGVQLRAIKMIRTESRIVVRRIKVVTLYWITILEVEWEGGGG